VEASQLLAAGIAAYHAGRLDEAEAVSEELIRRWPELAEGYELKGALRFQAKRHEEAVQCFRRSLSLNGRNANGWNSLGVALMSLERWKEAGDAFLNTLALAPDHLAAARSLGYLLEKLERPTEAARHFLSLLQRFGPRDDILEDYIRAMVAQGRADDVLSSLPQGFHPAAVELLTARSLLEVERWDEAEGHGLASLKLAHVEWPSPEVQLEYFRAMFYLLDVLRQKKRGQEFEALFRPSCILGFREAFQACGAQLPHPRPSPGRRLAVVVPGFINEHFGPTVLVMGLLIRFAEDLGWETVLLNCDYSFYNQALADVHGVVKLPPGRSRYAFAGREIEVFTPAGSGLRQRFEEIGRFLEDFAPEAIFTAGTELNPYADFLAACWPTMVVPMNWHPPYCYGHLYHVPSDDPAVVSVFRQAVPVDAELLPYGRLFPFVLPHAGEARNRAEFGLGNGDFVYLIAGLQMGAAFTPDYQRVLADILEEVESARMLVIGTRESDVSWLEPRLERWRGSRLHFFSYEPGLRAVLRLGDVFLHAPVPRNGGTVRQCLAEGVPVVVARQSGLKLVVPEEDMLDSLDAYRDVAIRLARDPAFRERVVARSRELDTRFEAEAVEYMQTMEKAAFRAVEIFQRTRDTHFLCSDKVLAHGG
jgi:tetratricopeptide (TPR) repeat protein